MSEQVIIFSQIVFIDLVLAGDNAIIIGMVASKFPPAQRKKVIFWGIGGAVILRIILTLLTAYLLQITGLRLIGGILLLYVIYKLYTDVIRDKETNDKDIKVDKSNLIKVEEDQFIEEFLPQVVCSNSNCEVVDKKGNAKGYISNKELQESLSNS